MKYRILIVEDEAIIAADIEQRLLDLGYEVVGKSATGMDACEKAASLHPDLVLMDIVLRGDLSGIEAARWIRDQQGIPVVYLTSHADASTVEAACTTEPYAYLLKPLSERELRVTLQVVLQKRNSDARARRIEHWLAATLQSIADAIITTDKEGRITFLNTQAETITGWDLEQAVFRPLRDVFEPASAETGVPHPDPALVAIERDAALSCGPRTVIRTRGGSRVFVDESTAPIRDLHGNVCGAVVVFRDATKATLSELEIVRLKDDLEQTVQARTAELVAANRELEMFTAFASHDLRKPLQAIYSNAFMLGSNREAPLSNAAHVLAERIQTASLQMGAMLDAFLKLAHLGRRELEFERVAMRPLVDQALRDLEAELALESVEIEVGELHGVWGDPVLLRQIWANLLSNAVKFTRGCKERRIEVGSRMEGERAVFHVRDTGIGFSMHDASQLFRAFQRMPSAKGVAGHGLGLALVRRIVQRHEGTVWAESRPGAGACFYFSLPTEPAERGGERES
jgi:PAS domain S-box-containing protein